MAKVRLKKPQSPEGAASVDVALDPIAEVFLHLERRTNLTVMLLLLVDGRLDPVVLRQSVDEILPRFPILLSSPNLDRGTITLHSCDPKEAPVDEIDYTGDGDFSFANPAFRRFVVSFSVDTPVRWESAAPVHFWLFQDRRADRKRRSCLMITMSHAVVDHASAMIFQECLLTTYGALASPGPSRPSSPPAQTHSFEALNDLFRSASGLARLATGAKALAQVAVDLSRRRDFKLHRLPSTGVDDFRRSVDVYYEVLCPEWQRDIRRLSKASGHTIGTLFTVALCRAIRREEVAMGLATVFSLRNVAGVHAKDHFRNFALPVLLRVPAATDTGELLNSVASQVAALKAGGIRSEMMKFEMASRLLRRGGWRRTLAFWLSDRTLASGICYSNPGIARENLRTFGTAELPVLECLATGGIIPPLHAVLFTPEIHRDLQIVALYFADAFHDIERQLIHPLKEQLQILMDTYLGGVSSRG